MAALVHHQPQGKNRGSQKTEPHGVKYGLQAKEIGEKAANRGSRGSDSECENKECPISQALPMRGHVF